MTDFSRSTLYYFALCAFFGSSSAVTCYFGEYDFFVPYPRGTTYCVAIYSLDGSYTYARSHVGDLPDKIATELVKDPKDLTKTSHCHLMEHEDRGPMIECFCKSHFCNEITHVDDALHKFLYKKKMNHLAATS
uniref:Uncharacterized protein n=1 Tax=Caenorhabditis japonica TaxID=281687 RepID=A0A8R1E9Y3_CAEJA